ncbi:ABC transporter permease [Glaciibacter psychrotolerans]|uniref:Putative ABC transport system permease protein n=1 Tax=Glaciibacter psychrotolerans TaxID=670054 RepID=A0A7Z0EFZ0_9MICO|nr:ABC transporter permease [Leifsonia psychrotolerans]NYJ20934.1 putative ABC transport system permease protein [Leifsonia psychrotolerans]
MTAAVELGLLYATMALGVYLTFKVLNFPDLTVDGSFTTGAAVAAKLIIDGVPAIWATLAGAAAGAIAGVVTGLLYTKGKIDGLLAGILTMIALYSINLRIMGKSNLPLLREETLFTPLRDAGLMGSISSILIFAGIAVVIKLIIDWFLHTDLGLSIQATGNNAQMIRSFGVNTDRTTILTLAISNGLVALCGGLIAQYQGFADVGMGIGLILIGLASVIVGQAVFGSRTIFIATTAVILGAIIYRVVIFLALGAGLNPNDMKLISAVLVVAALLLPRWGFLKKVPTLRQLTSRTIVKAG